MCIFIITRVVENAVLEYVINDYIWECVGYHILSLGVTDDNIFI